MFAAIPIAECAKRLSIIVTILLMLVAPIGLLVVFLLPNGPDTNQELGIERD